MTDLGMTIAPKSSQLNADDLTAGPRTVTITKVSANRESAEQPIAISFEGDEGRPFYPCKTVRRILVTVWGRDGNEYVGRAMTLFRDPKVTWGGMEVGGIRVSHMSHIDKPITMALTATRANRKPYTVKPLETRKDPQKPAPRPEPEDDGEPFSWPDWLKSMGQQIAACETIEELAELQSDNADLIAELGQKSKTNAEKLNMRFGDRSRAILESDGDV